MEYARIAAALGHSIVLYEREHETGGHVRAYGSLPYRDQYGSIAMWLSAQAVKNGASITLGHAVADRNIDEIPRRERPDHIVVATGARYRRDGFQGQTGKALTGWETGHCVIWDEVALGTAKVNGEVLVIDEMADVAAPLTAVKLAKSGVPVRLLTKWPMVGWETTAEVYLHWVLTYLYEANVEIITDHFVRSIAGSTVEAINIYKLASVRTLKADTIVMATARSSENSLYHLLKAKGLSVETIGCATAPRTVYEATYEGHRAARRLAN